MANIKKISFLISFLIIRIISFCQNDFYTLPEITNFFDINNPLTTDQVWDIKQTNEGLIYVASSNHFLEFDGIKWNEFINSVGTVFYSFDIDTSNRYFYVGTKNSIIINKFINGSYKTHEIYIPENISSTWRTFFKDQKAYFFINKKDVIVYDEQNIELLNRDTNFYITRGFNIDNQIYAVSNNGIGKINKDKLHIISKNYPEIYNEDIRVILKYSEDLLLVGTHKGNLYLFDYLNDEFKPFSTEANKYLNESQIYYGAQIDENTFAIGTLKGGLVIIDNEGKIINILNKKTGLLSNAIYCVFVDKQKNIWLGTGMGVSLVQWGSSVRYFDKRNKIDDMLSAVLVFSDHILVGTAEGIYYTENNELFNTNFKEFDYKIMYSNCFLNAKIGNSRYLITTGYDNVSLFDENLKFISSFRIPKSIKAVQSPVIENRFYISNFNELVALKLILKNNIPTFEIEKKFYELPFNVENIIFDSNNNLWVCQGKNLFLVDFDEEESVEEYTINFYDSNSGLPESKILNVFEYKNRFFVSTALGLYYLQNKDENFSFYKFSKYQSGVLSELKDEIIISTVSHNNYTYFLTTNSIYKIDDLTEEISSIYFNNIFDYFLTSLSYSSGYLWTISKEKIFCIDPKNFNNFTIPTNNLLLRSIKIGKNRNHYIYNSDSIIDFNENEYILKNKIEWKDNNISFDFVLPYYYNCSSTKYLYKMNDEEKQWEEINKNNLSFRSLSAGNYNIYVKAINFFGQESNTIVIKFKIKNKPFFSVFAIVCYALLLVFLIYIYAYFRNKKIKKDKRRLNDIVKQKTKQLEQQKEELMNQSKVLDEQKNLLKKESERLELAIIELRQLSLVARKTDNSVLILEKNGKIEWWNRGFTDLFAYKIEQYKNISFRNAFIKIRPDINREIAGYTKDKGTISYTTQEVFDNGEEIWYQTTINPVYDDNGELFKFVVIDTNISDIKNAENEIIKQKNEIKTLNEKLSKLTADLSITSENLKNYIKYDKTNLIYAKILHEVFTKNTLVECPHIRYFIYDRPLDELSGDFIWSIRYNNNLYIAIGDATGHRVRGTIISVIGISVLKEIIIRNSELSLANILHIFNEKFYSIFNATDVIKNQDTIDMALIKLSVQEERLYFCGAKIPMYLVRNEFKHTLYSFEADRISIGSNTDKTFAEQFTSINNNDRIYFSTDGWINQLGKMGQKKYTTKKFKDYILSVQSIDIEKQRNFFKDEINNWRGNFEQVDDIFIFGAEINL